MFPESLLAHQGGWDEFLMVATPIGIFVMLLRAANRRAQEAADAEGSEDPDRTGDDPPDDR